MTALSVRIPAATRPCCSEHWTWREEAKCDLTPQCNIIKLAKPSGGINVDFNELLILGFTVPLFRLAALRMFADPLSIFSSVNKYLDLLNDKHSRYWIDVWIIPCWYFIHFYMYVYTRTRNVHEILDIHVLLLF